MRANSVRCRFCLKVPTCTGAKPTQLILYVAQLLFLV